MGRRPAASCKAAPRVARRSVQHRSAPEMMSAPHPRPAVAQLSCAVSKRTWLISSSWRAVCTLRRKARISIWLSEHRFLSKAEFSPEVFLIFRWSQSRAALRGGASWANLAQLAFPDLSPGQYGSILTSCASAGAVQCAHFRRPKRWQLCKARLPPWTALIQMAGALQAERALSIRQTRRR